MKVSISFGKSEPYNSGWRGWSDNVLIFLDGTEIGSLAATDCDQRRHLCYHLHTDHPAQKAYTSIGVYGLRDAKKAAREAFEKMQAHALGKS